MIILNPKKEKHYEQRKITKILIKNNCNLSEKLFNIYKIEDELSNDKTTLLLCGIGTSKRKLERLKKVLKNFGF